MIFRVGEIKYEFLEGWGEVPEGEVLDDIAGVYVDSKDHVYALNRGENPVIVFDQDGNHLKSWGREHFIHAHGIYIGPEDEIYCIDDYAHTLLKFTSSGKILMTIGEKEKPSNSGCENRDFRTIKQGAPPFNAPTNVALSFNKDIYVSDGYGNSRIHKFKPDGSLVNSWGEPGDSPGQFNLPHNVCVGPNNRIFVADRENDRIQIFTSEGEFIEKWTDVIRPNGLFIDKEDYLYVAELGKQVGLYDWMKRPDSETPGSRISIFNLEGELLSRWEGNSSMPGIFHAAHGICVDSAGSIYLSEVARTAVGCDLEENYFALKKFVRVQE